MVRVRTRMNHQALNRIRQAQTSALEQTVKGAKESILAEIMAAEVVPKQTGHLERSATIDDSKSKRGKVTLIYDTPYARRLYWHPEYNFRRDKNRNAQGMWLEAWVNGQKDNIIKRTFSALWKKLAGGFIK